MPLTYGLGLEAAVSNHFTLGGDLGFASSGDYGFTFVDAVLKYYPFKRHRPFYLYAGPGFFNVSATDDRPALGRPFDTDRGDRVGIFNFSFGLGASTFVKDNIYLGFYMGIGAVADQDLESDYGEAGLSVGYGF